MTKTCTSIEQSKKLIELGIDINTADMYYQWYSETESALHVGKGSKKLNADCPVWSLSALMNLLDDESGLARDYGWWFCYDNRKSHYTKHYEEAIDAAFEMVVWLKENGKI